MSGIPSPEELGIEALTLDELRTALLALDVGEEWEPGYHPFATGMLVVRKEHSGRYHILSALLDWVQVPPDLDCRHFSQQPGDCPRVLCATDDPEEAVRVVWAARGGCMGFWKEKEAS